MIVGICQTTSPSRSAGTTMMVARAAIAGAIDKVRTNAGVLLLTDMFGGTPSNLGLAFLEVGRVEVITGVNLPMLITIAKATDDEDLLTRARKLCDHGRSAIRVASDLLRAEGRSEA
jgi:PTS system mannose-specific IIA component